MRHVKNLVQIYDAVADSAIGLDDEILILQKSGFLNSSQPHKSQ